MYRTEYAIDASWPKTQLSGDPANDDRQAHLGSANEIEVPRQTEKAALLRIPTLYGPREVWVPLGRLSLCAVHHNGDVAWTVTVPIRYVQGSPELAEIVTWMSGK